MPDWFQMPQWFEKGGVVMYPLLACSFFAVLLVIERFLFWTLESMRKKRRALDRIIKLTREKKYDEALEQARSCRDPVACVLASGLQSVHNSVSQAMEVAVRQQLHRLERFLPAMDTLITLSPLLGILGTVTGIIHSFDVLGASAIVDPQGVTKGVAEALITTAFGLVIAIFTLIPYNHYSQRAQKTLEQIEQYATRFELAVAENRR